MKTLKILAVTLGCAAISGLAPAQQVISTKSGTLNNVEGKVLLDGKPVEVKIGNFPMVRKESELRTDEGRAEVLLGPGVFLRMGESSAFKMLDDRILETRLELLSGSMVVESGGLQKDESVTVIYKDATINLLKDGVYRLDSEPARLMVYDGEAKVLQNGQTQSVKRARLLPLNGVAVAEKFDNKTGDSLFRWARHRAENLAVANVSAARSAGRWGNSFGSNGWVFNPYFGMFTYVPYNGIYNSFWGYPFWSPREVYSAYYVPRPSYTGGGGVPSTNHQTYTTIPATSTGNSGAVARTAAPTAASSAGTVSVPRESGSGHASGRGR
jgi:hypothetical protein